MKYPPDAGHPITEQWASQLFTLSDWSTIPETEPWRGVFGVVWETAAPEVREAFRARARQMLAGDLSVLPWTWPIGMVPLRDRSR